MSGATLIKRWDTERGFVLTMEVTVNGRVLRASSRVSDEMITLCGRMYPHMGMPAHYVERELRSMLMREIETELLGPRP